MTTWADQDVEARILEVLGDVPTTGVPHPFGRPFMTGYQLAIELHRRYPGVAADLGQQLGGAGIGERNSLAQYLPKQLSDRIRANPNHNVEGAFLSSVGVIGLTYSAPDGSVLTSSVSGSGYDLSMFRLRPN